MLKENQFEIHFSSIEFSLIFGSFNEVCNGFYTEKFEEKFCITLEKSKEYMKHIRPVRILMRDIRYKGEEFLPSEKKNLQNAITAYWDDSSSYVIFESEDKSYLFSQLENGKKSFDALTKMKLQFHETEKFSIILQASVFELQVMLNVVRETLQELHGEWGSEYHARLGEYPAEAEKTMAKLQAEIEKHSA